jgi:hypothetical protein
LSTVLPPYPVHGAGRTSSLSTRPKSRVRDRVRPERERREKEREQRESTYGSPIFVYDCD